jgi:hypothetical protein
MNQPNKKQLKKLIIKWFDRSSAMEEEEEEACVKVKGFVNKL